MEANSLKEAIEKALAPDTPLPAGEYLIESCEPAYDADEIRDLYNNGQKDEADE